MTEAEFNAMNLRIQSCKTPGELQGLFWEVDRIFEEGKSEVAEYVAKLIVTIHEQGLAWGIWRVTSSSDANTKG